jgi:hypothetical protein
MSGGGNSPLSLALPKNDGVDAELSELGKAVLRLDKVLAAGLPIPVSLGDETASSSARAWRNLGTAGG